MKTIKQHIIPVIYSLDQPYFTYGDGVYKYPQKMAGWLREIAYRDWYVKHRYLIKTIGKHYEIII